MAVQLLGRLDAASGFWAALIALVLRILADDRLLIDCVSDASVWRRWNIQFQ